MRPAVSREHPPADHVILHLSDTHLVADGLLYGGVDSGARLAALLEQTVASGVEPEALVFTGDLADKGHPEAYARLRGIVEPIAERLGAKPIWVMGNHDDRARLRTGLLGEPPEEAPLYGSYRLGGLRVITLDTSVPGYHHGEICAEQFTWLADQLAHPAPEGTILAMHHPPVPMIQDLAVLTELRRQDVLEEALRDSDVRLILGGHLHFSSAGTFAGIPVSVASATCYTQDLTVEVGGSRGRDGAQALNLVHVYPDTIINSVVPIGSFPTVGQYVSPEETQRRLGIAGVGGTVRKQ
ncbi:phosphodiesterase [uncultured Arthrobacter sp.]|uniref:phosphodiesterase n=1 Tax=uncultured Arthrobacter sp. TaxID=114050 RepID=UPI0025E9398A|nr:phosphodiesterase [uncultured Arthrobacter sp.]